MDSPGFTCTLLDGNFLGFSFKTPIMVGFKKLSKFAKEDICAGVLEVGTFTAVRNPIDDFGRVCSLITFSVYGKMMLLTSL